MFWVLLESVCVTGHCLHLLLFPLDGEVDLSSVVYIVVYGVILSIVWILTWVGGCFPCSLASLCCFSISCIDSCWMTKCCCSLSLTPSRPWILIPIWRVAVIGKEVGGGGGVVFTGVVEWLVLILAGPLGLHHASTRRWASVDLAAAD